MVRVNALSRPGRFRVIVATPSLTAYSIVCAIPAPGQAPGRAEGARRSTRGQLPPGRYPTMVRPGPETQRRQSKGAEAGRRRGRDGSGTGQIASDSIGGSGAYNVTVTAGDGSPLHGCGKTGISVIFG